MHKARGLPAAPGSANLRNGAKNLCQLPEQKNPEAVRRQDGGSSRRMEQRAMDTPHRDELEAAMDLSLQAFAMEFDASLERPITVWDQPLECERFGRELSSHVARRQPDDARQTMPELYGTNQDANEDRPRQCRLLAPARHPGRMQALFGRLQSAVSLLPWKPSQIDDATAWSSKDSSSLPVMTSHRFEGKPRASARPATGKDRKKREGGKRRDCSVAGTPAK